MSIRFIEKHKVFKLDSKDTSYIIAIVDILATDRPFSVQNVMHQNSDILIDIIKCNDELPAKMPAAFLLEKTAYCMYKVE